MLSQLAARTPAAKGTGAAEVSFERTAADG